ncbi:hypothetical protein AB0M29_29305 [Streptomyces sp. NPDC051976]|uniref:SecDF P1 head subdomain-containing protein n=1 Tax=Streptomyces sp. NPDC051976 TaxID=3154947 RepID=UPI00343291E0
MRSYRRVSATSLAVAVMAVGSLLTACSSDSSGDDPVALKGPGAHTPPTGQGSGTPASARTTATYTLDTGTGAVALDETVRRLKARAAAFGLDGAVIEAHGSTITAQAPGDATDKLRQIAATANLLFRPVLTDGAATPEVRKAYATLDCSPKSHGTALPSISSQPTAGCDRDLGQKYLLGPAAIVGTDVKSAKSQLATGGQWAVDLDFTAAGSAKFAAITATLSQQTSPANQFAIVLDGDVLSAPMVQQAITGGQAQITGTFTRQRAVDLAALISSGALPVRLTVGSVTVQR